MYDIFQNSMPLFHGIHQYEFSQKMPLYKQFGMDDNHKIRIRLNEAPRLGKLGTEMALRTGEGGETLRFAGAGEVPWRE